ncbi:MAG: hypothetical protein ACOX4I_04970 [Anaerovoracaceae bacterium]|jgi:hypothetical protein
MFDNIITDEAIDMLLRQQDADEISSRPGHIGRVSFVIHDDIKAVYQYSVTDNGLLFLQRIEPDPFSFGRILEASDAVKNIAYDLHNYRRAVQNGAYEEFVRLSEGLNALHNTVEDLFLMYNPDGEKVQAIYDEMKLLHKKMKEICLEKQGDGVR